MNKVEKPWDKLFKFLFFVFGVPFSLIGIILLNINGNISMIINGAIWIIFGLSCKIISILNKRKIERLKENGTCCTMIGIKVIPAHWIKIGNYITAKIEMTYKINGDKKISKSDFFLLSPFDKVENLYAKIYIDNYNLDKYVIELFRENNGVFVR